jgi:hypothetical protein
MRFALHEIGPRNGSLHRICVGDGRETEGPLLVEADQLADLRPAIAALPHGMWRVYDRTKQRCLRPAEYQGTLPSQWTGS